MAEERAALLREIDRVMSDTTDVDELFALLARCRAALAETAIPREPTEAMMEAAQVLVMTANVMEVGPELADLWRAMWDAALADAGQKGKE